ncbi:hypothetical protein JB92DRAFT_2829904 [Gautieria morchelliformis]|nr:hypothetical protein JB92DRAFT_2829904 [Gautieria morchelliformis]
MALARLGAMPLVNVSFVFCALAHINPAFQSTGLSCSLADQGIKIRIRKDIRVRKRPSRSNPSGGGGHGDDDDDDDDDEDEYEEDERGKRRGARSGGSGRRKRTRLEEEQGDQSIVQQQMRHPHHPDPAAGGWGVNVSVIDPALTGAPAPPPPPNTAAPPAPASAQGDAAHPPHDPAAGYPHPAQHPLHPAQHPHPGLPYPPPPYTHPHYPPHYQMPYPPAPGAPAAGYAPPLPYGDPRAYGAPPPGPPGAPGYADPRGAPPPHAYRDVYRDYGPPPPPPHYGYATPPVPAPAGGPPAAPGAPAAGTPPGSGSAAAAPPPPTQGRGEYRGGEVYPPSAPPPPPPQSQQPQHGGQPPPQSATQHGGQHPTQQPTQHTTSAPRGEYAGREYRATSEGGGGAGPYRGPPPPPPPPPPGPPGPGGEGYGWEYRHQWCWSAVGMRASGDDGLPCDLRMSGDGRSSRETEALPPGVFHSKVPNGDGSRLEDESYLAQSSDARLGNEGCMIAGSLNENPYGMVTTRCSSIFYELGRNTEGTLSSLAPSGQIAEYGHVDERGMDVAGLVAGAVAAVTSLRRGQGQFECDPGGEVGCGCVPEYRRGMPVWERLLWSCPMGGAREGAGLCRYQSGVPCRVAQGPSEERQWRRGDNSCCGNACVTEGSAARSEGNTGAKENNLIFPVGTEPRSLPGTPYDFRYAGPPGMTGPPGPPGPPPPGGYAGWYEGYPPQPQPAVQTPSLRQPNLHGTPPRREGAEEGVANRSTANATTTPAAGAGGAPAYVPPWPGGGGGSGGDAAPASPVSVTATSGSTAPPRGSDPSHPPSSQTPHSPSATASAADAASRAPSINATTGATEEAGGSPTRGGYYGYMQHPQYAHQHPLHAPHQAYTHPTHPAQQDWYGYARGWPPQQASTPNQAAGQGQLHGQSQTAAQQQPATQAQTQGAPSGQGQGGSPQSAHAYYDARYASGGYRDERAGASASAGGAAASAAGDRIELAPLRGAGTPPRVGSLQGARFDSQSQSQGQSRGTQNRSHAHGQSHNQSGHGHGHGAGDRVGNGKKNPLSIGSIISDHRDE